MLRMQRAAFSTDIMPNRRGDTEKQNPARNYGIVAGPRKKMGPCRPRLFWHLMPTLRSLLRRIRRMTGELKHHDRQQYRQPHTIADQEKQIIGNIEYFSHMPPAMNEGNAVTDDYPIPA